jgi:hypothetical protein
MRNAKRSGLSESTVVTGLVTILTAAGAALAGDKIPVKSADDLPRHTYTIPGKVSELLQSDEQFAALAKAVRADLEADLAKYEIGDATALQRLYGVVLNLNLLEGRLERVSEDVARLRELETKEAKKLTTGLVAEAWVAARKRAGQDDDEFRTALRQDLLRRLRDLPWEVVADEIKQRKAQLEIATEPFLMGMVQSSLDPTVEKNEGRISSDVAHQIVSLRFMLKIAIPIRSAVLSAYQAVIDEHTVSKRDIWTERQVTLTGEQKLTPVVVAVWDSGVDTTLFSQQLWKNEKETLDGQDEDGNGFVDDVHGIAYDLDFHRTTGLLHPLDDLKADVAEVTRYMKGFMDLQAALETPEAAGVRTRLSELRGEAVKQFIEDLGLFGNYCHGTHVAGIAAEGNPALRLLTVRISFDYRVIPQCPTVELARREADAERTIVGYLRQHGARVVNMSWGGDRKSIESALEKNGVGATAEERARLAREIYAIQREGLYEALKSAPEVLFICAAGNADNDVEFDEMIPAGFDLPNLLVVGAVDQAGAPTSFTSFGKTVQVYACGFEVDSYIPGGQRMRLSGTSMAAPNVTNLAAKLLALDPTLKPAQIIDLIKRGAEKAEGARPMLLINPKKTVELLHK